MNIEIDTDLYVRLQQCLLEGLPYKDLKHFQDCLAEVKTGETKDPLAYHVHTLLYLLEKIEASAKKAGHVSIKKFDLEKGELVDPSEK